MPEVDHDARCQRLPVGAGAATTRRQDDVAIGRLRQHAGDGGEIGDAPGKQERRRLELIDRIVRRVYRAAARPAVDVARKPLGAQTIEKGRLGRWENPPKSWDHRKTRR